MSTVRESTRSLHLKEDEPPPKKHITEADMLIKKLAKKQQNTNATLNTYLQTPKTFEKVTEHISLTSCHSGTASLPQFKDVVDRIEVVEHLRAAGIDNESIQLLLDYQENKISTKHRNISQSVLQEKLQALHKTLQNYEGRPPESQESQRNLDLEDNLTMKPNSTETRLLKFALDNKPNVASLPHPMDNLKKLESDMFSHLNESTLNPKKIQRRIRNINNKVNNIGNAPVNCDKQTPTIKTEVHSFTVNSKWDKIESLEPTTVEKTKLYTCKPCNYYTIKDGQIVKLNNDAVKERGLDISTHKLRVEEIQKLPKFERYLVGKPSKVLYLKNLPKHITEQNLKEIFKEYHDSTLIFKMMTGRMKGQAFVTFPEIEDASRALENINGLLINDKPVVIEYGKK